MYIYIVHIIIFITLQGRYYSTYFTDMQTEVQKIQLAEMGQAKKVQVSGRGYDHRLNENGTGADYRKGQWWRCYLICSALERL